YDVHYLVQLRRLMIRDLVNISGGLTDNAKAENASNLHAMIQAMNDEDGIVDDNVLISVVGLALPDDEDDPASTGDGATDKPPTLYTAKELRMNLEVMRAISASQNKCLSLWNDRQGNHLKDPGYVKIMTNDRKEGREWTPSQLQLYKSLSQWREHLASKYGILPGFVCGSDFLAKIARVRPGSKAGMKQITYHLPYLLLQNNEEYLNIFLVLVQQSRAEDNLTDYVVLPSYDDSMKASFWGDGNTWFYIVGLVAAFSASVVL
ncbi:MAG: hypothetical protein SGILL_008024, partial [Bacillariaceae sp.]